MSRLGSFFAPSIALGLLLFHVEIASAKSACGLPWERLDEGARNLARPYSLSLTGAAVLPPIALAPTGADYDLRRTSQLELGGSYSPEPVSLAAPYVFYPASWLFFVGSAALGYCPGQTRSVAIIQATSETLLVVGLIKWTTGRTWPLGGRAPDHPEVLEHPEDGNSWAPFRSGLGAFPSGHTAFFFAAAGAFRAASPDLGILRYAGYPVAAAIGFAMWYGDHHWASDVLSGALLGEAIGAAAGRTWAPAGRDEEVSFLVLPTRTGALGALSSTF
jgi:membrane-associated phospholipid phosphatase